MKNDEYFSKINALTENEHIELRIRYLLKGGTCLFTLPPFFTSSCMFHVLTLYVIVIEMRENGWVGRKDREGPKTIEEIHRDAQAKKTQKSADLARYRSLSSSCSRNRLNCTLDGTDRVGYH